MFDGLLHNTAYILLEFNCNLRILYNYLSTASNDIKGYILEKS